MGLPGYAWVTIGVGGALLLLHLVGDSYKWRNAPHRHIKTSALVKEFQPLVDLFERRIRSGEDLGGSLAVWIDGKPVVSVSGGSAGSEQDAREVLPDSLSICFSTTKTQESLVIAMLVDRGYLDYDQPIAKYWPEFAQNGKEKITVRDLMRHEACLNFVDEMYTPEHCLPENREKLANYLERQCARMAPGQKDKLAYHAISRGLFASVLCEKVDPKGRSMGTFYKEEVADKLGIDFHFPVPNEHEHRIIAMQPQPQWFQTFNILPHLLLPNWLCNILFRESLERSDVHMLTSVMRKGSHTHTSFMSQIDEGTGQPAKDVDPRQMSTPRYYRGEWPSSHGFGNANALAKVANALACGGQLNGIRIISERTLERANKHTGPNFCDVMKRNIVFCDAGWCHFDMKHQGVQRGTGWVGFGGVWVIWDPQTRMSFSYVPMSANSSAYDYRGRSLLNMTFQILSEGQYGLETHPGKMV
eukprot:Clim_evm10s239 gene=Clim_evmTU10s239